MSKNSNLQILNKLKENVLGNIELMMFFLFIFYVNRLISITMCNKASYLTMNPYQCGMYFSANTRTNPFKGIYLTDLDIVVGDENLFSLEMILTTESMNLFVGPRSACRKSPHFILKCIWGLTVRFICLNRF